MVKGQVIGGGAAPKRRGGMLPPVKAGPIEVTREYIEEKERTEAAQEQAGQGSPQESVDLAPRVPGLPGEDAPKSDIVAAASAVIYSAVVRFEDGQRRLTSQLFAEAGPAVRLVHATESFKEDIDQLTGRPYRSFRKWASDRGLSKSNAYRMINEVPVAEALTGVYDGTIPAGHLDVLAPVLRQHGADALRKLWKTAEAGARAARDGGRPTVNDLVNARQILELEVRPEDNEPPVAADPAKAFKAVQDALRVLADTEDVLRVAMQHDPDAVRDLFRKVFGTINLELGESGS